MIAADVLSSEKPFARAMEFDIVVLAVMCGDIVMMPGVKVSLILREATIKSIIVVMNFMSAGMNWHMNWIWLGDLNVGWYVNGVGLRYFNLDRLRHFDVHAGFYWVWHGDVFGDCYWVRFRNFHGVRLRYVYLDWDMFGDGYRVGLRNRVGHIFCNGYWVCFVNWVGNVLGFNTVGMRVGIDATKVTMTMVTA